jgi:meiotically up-regulated gene 157 (Mug157) protein
VARIRSLFLVTLTEYWDASVFHGGDSDPHNGQLSYAWRYEVDGAGNVTFVDSSGNFPPGEVR